MLADSAACGALRLKKRNQVFQAVGGVLCLVVGAFLAIYPWRRYAETHYVVDAAACRMDLSMIRRADLAAEPDRGSVVLFHGIAANKIVMQYLARAFAELGLRVFVPDLPGHGRSPGPFTPERAESCSASLLRGLAARGMIIPNRTILAGHSMGGAIALRVADKFRPAAVIAISPAPMQPAHGVVSENLLFHTLPLLTPNTLILVGQLEPARLRDNAADLSGSPTGWVKFQTVPLNTHVSMLFSPTVARVSQTWAAQALFLSNHARLPSHANLLAGLLGIIGLLLIGGPFLREMTGGHPAQDLQATGPVSPLRGALEVALFSILAVQILRYGEPLRILYLFEGDYVASFFLIVGLGLILLHLKPAWDGLRSRPGLILGAAVAAILLHFLLTGWFELTVTGAWLNGLRWERFPLFLPAAFLYLYGIELIAGPVRNAYRRFAFWFLLLVLAWLPIVFGVLFVRTGEILPVILSPFFAIQALLVGLGIQLVRREAGSPTAAAVFGAILLAGFCLVLFPLS
jgi:pimeloyl-ACP methyl ester carboxylesterase